MNSYCLKTSLPSLINYAYSNASKTDFYLKVKLVSLHSLWTLFLCNETLFFVRQLALNFTQELNMNYIQYLAKDATK